MRFTFRWPRDRDSCEFGLLVEPSFGDTTADGISCGWLSPFACVYACLLCVYCLVQNLLKWPFLVTGNGLPDWTNPDWEVYLLHQLSPLPMPDQQRPKHWYADRFYSPLRADGLGQLRVHSLPKVITRQRADWVGSAGNRTRTLKSSRP
jgi:hypothetical protein